MTNYVAHFSLDSFVASLPVTPAEDTTVFVQRLQEERGSFPRLLTSFIVLSHDLDGTRVHLARVVVETLDTMSGLETQVRQRIDQLEDRANRAWALLCAAVQRDGVQVREGLLLPVGFDTEHLRTMRTSQHLFRITGDALGDERSLERLEGTEGADACPTA
jgi:hypothetical protein